MALTFDDKKNFAYSVIATAPSPAASGTSLVVAASDGAKFPAVPFNAVVWPTGVQPTTANAEIVRVTNKSSDTFTITRQQESTSARTILVNDQIACNITAKTLTDIQAAFTTASVLATPIGAILVWPTDSAPTGFLLCRGQAVSRATYADLFSLIGTTYGGGDGSTTFNVPDLQGRLAIGKATSGTIGTLAVTAGSWDHTHGPGTLTVASHTHGPGTLTVASHTHGSGTLQVASHSHGAGTLTVASHSHGLGSGSTSSGGSHTHTGTTSESGDHTHTLNANGDAEGGSGATQWDSVTQSGGAHTHSFTTSSDGSHSHSLSGSSDSDSPSVNSGSTGTSAPLVNSGSTGSTSPAVNAGVTASANPVVDSGVTAAGNPPVLVLNYIIRATNEA